MYVIEITRIDHRTGETRTWKDRKRYKTLHGAQQAALGWSSVTRPDGRMTTVETLGKVILDSD